MITPMVARLVRDPFDREEINNRDYPRQRTVEFELGESHGSEGAGELRTTES